MLEDALTLAWYVVPSSLIVIIGLLLWRSVTGYLDDCDRAYGRERD